MSARTLADVARRIVRECVDLKPEEVCLVLSDWGPMGMASALEAAVRECGATPLVLGIAIGDYARGKIAKGVEAILTAVDVVLLCTREIFPHAARKLAAQAGARVVSLGTATPEMVLRACDLDYGELSQVTRRAAAAYGRAAEVTMQTAAGTDVRMRIRQEPVHWIDGLARERGQVTALPAGVVAALPVPETAEGMIVIDASIHSLGLVKEPVRLRVEKGRITEVAGGETAEQFRRLLASADVNAYCVAEVGLGTNPKAAYVGNLVEDERVLGSGHIGFGRNVQLGGTIESTAHIDTTMRRPTICLDGQRIAAEGRLLL